MVSKMSDSRRAMASLWAAWPSARPVDADLRLRGLTLGGGLIMSLRISAQGETAAEIDTGLWELRVRRRVVHVACDILLLR